MTLRIIADRAWMPAIVLAATAGFLIGGRASSMTDGPPAPAPAGRNVPVSDPAVFREKILGFSAVVGSVRVEKLTYWNLPALTDMRSRLRITPDGDWHFENSTSKFCGGRMTEASSVIDFDRVGKRGRKMREFRLAAEFAGIRFEELTRHAGMPVMPGEVSLRMGLRVTSEGRDGLSGRAELRLRKGDLGHLPFVVKTLSFLTLSGFSTEPREEIDARVTMPPRALVFEDLEFRTKSRSFRIVAERGGPAGGYVTYDGGINARFRPKFASELQRRLEGLPGSDVIMEVLTKIKERGGRVQVTGSVYEPKFEWAPFR